MCPVCVGSTLLLLSGATTAGGLGAFVAGKALHRVRAAAVSAGTERLRRRYVGKNKGGSPRLRQPA